MAFIPGLLQAWTGVWILIAPYSQGLLLRSNAFTELWNTCELVPRGQEITGE